MKNLKHLFFIFFALVLTITPKSQDDDPPPSVDEISIFNTSSTRNLTFKIFPVSMIMNGNNFYDLHTKYPDNQGNIRYRYLTTGHLNNGNFVSTYTLSPNGYVGFQHEVDAQSDGSSGIMGFGIYKIVFNWGSGGDTCLLEFDAATANDLGFEFKDDTPGGGPRIVYTWSETGCPERNISAANRYIKSWERKWCGTTDAKNYGNFVYTTHESNTYTILPQDYRQDCGDENYPVDFDL
jgi:hypothetical protein